MAGRCLTSAYARWRAVCVRGPRGRRGAAHPDARGAVRRTARGRAVGGCAQRRREPDVVHARGRQGRSGRRRGVSEPRHKAPALACLAAFHRGDRAGVGGSSRRQRHAAAHVWRAPRLSASSMLLRAADPNDDAGFGMARSTAALSLANFFAHPPEQYRFPATDIPEHKPAAPELGDPMLQRTRVVPLKRLLASQPAQVMCPHALLSSALGQYIFRPRAAVESAATELVKACADFEERHDPSMSMRSAACTLASLDEQEARARVNASHVLCMALAPQTFLTSDVPSYTVDGHVFSTLCSLRAACTKLPPPPKWMDVGAWFDCAKTYRDVVAALTWMGRQRTAPLLGHILGAYLDPAAFLQADSTGSFTRHWTDEPNKSSGDGGAACACLTFGHYCRHACAQRPSTVELRVAEDDSVCSLWTDLWRGAHAVAWLAAAVDATLVKESHLRCLVAHPTYFVSAKDMLRECADHAAAPCSPLWTAIQQSEDLKMRTVEHFATDEPVLLHLHSTMRPVVYWVMLLTVAMRFRNQPCAHPERHLNSKQGAAGIGGAASWPRWILSWFTRPPQAVTSAPTKDTLPRDFVRVCYVDFVKSIVHGDSPPLSASECPPLTVRLSELERGAAGAAAQGRGGAETWAASALAALGALRAALSGVLTVAICSPEDVGKTTLAKQLTGQTDGAQSASGGIDLYHRTVDLDWRRLGNVAVGPGTNRPCFVLDTPGVFVSDIRLKQTLVMSYVQCCCVVAVVVAWDRASLWSDVMDACMTRIHDAHRLHDTASRFVVLLNKFDALVQRSGWNLDEAHRVAYSLCGYVERTYPWVDRCSVSMLLTPERSLVGRDAPHLVQALQGDIDEGRVLDGQHIGDVILALLQRNSLCDRVGIAPSVVDLAKLVDSQC